MGERNFSKVTTALKTGTVAGHCKLMMTNGGHHWSWSSYNYTRRCWRTQHWLFCARHLKQTGKMKKLYKWVPHELIKHQKIFYFEVSSSHSTQQLWIISQSDCDVQRQVGFIKHPVISSEFGQRRSSKAFPKAKLVPKKCHGYCLVVCCWSDLLELSEFWWNHYTWDVCSANWWDAPKTAMSVASIGQQHGPNAFPQQHQTHIAQPTFQKLNKVCKVNKKCVKNVTSYQSQ